MTFSLARLLEHPSPERPTEMKRTPLPSPHCFSYLFNASTRRFCTLSFAQWPKILFILSKLSAILKHRGKTWRQSCVCPLIDHRQEPIKMREQINNSLLLTRKLYRHECFTGKCTARKIHTKLHPGLKWRIFRILTSEDIDDFTDIRWCMIETSSGLPRKSSISNFRKFSENVGERSSCLRNSFGKSSEIFLSSPRNIIYLCQDICPRTSSVPRSEEFSESVARVKLWALRGTDNVQGQTSEQYFRPKMEAIVFIILQIFFQNARNFKNWEIFSDIPQF